MMEDALTCWNSEVPTMDARVEEIEHFDAREQKNGVKSMFDP
jgi:hypothetical protein